MVPSSMYGCRCAELMRRFNITSPFSKALFPPFSSSPFGPCFSVNASAFRTNKVATAQRERAVSSAISLLAGKNGRARNRLLFPDLNQYRSLFIQTESTPNPESIKFLPGRDVLTEEQAEDNKGFYATASDKDEIARSPLAKELFKVDGVKSIYFGKDFVTVTKFATAHWAHLRTLVFSTLMDFYSAESPQPALADAAIITDTTILDDDDEVVAMIKELLETRIRPAVQEDGGDIRYVGYEEETGIVSVKLAGSCVGCPSSAVTLKNGVENMLMHYIPEITAVNAIEENEEGLIVDSTTGKAVEVETTKVKTYEERLAAAGIPYSD